MRRAVNLHDVFVFRFHLINKLLALGLHKNLDARLVDVVAAAEAVVGANNGFQVVKDLHRGQKFANRGAQDRRAAHAAAHQHLEAHIALRILDHVQPNVMPGSGRAVFAGAGNRDLELARQKRELGVQGAPLAHDFCERARVGQLICGNASAFVTGDVADAIAAGLNAMHVDAGQQVHHVGRLVQWNPVVLHVLARGEVGIALGQAAVYW